MASSQEIAEKFVKHLEENLVEHLKEQMEQMISHAIQVHFEGMNRRFDSFERTTDAWKMDFDEDRKTLQTLRVDSDHLNTEVNELRRTVDKLPKRMENQIDNSVSSSVAEAVPQAVSESFDVSGKNVVVKKRKRFIFF